jgi:superfamily II DNA or RNA helicase
MLKYVSYDFKYKIGLSATIERLDNAHWDILRIFDYNLFKYTSHEALNEEVLNPFNFSNVAVEMDEDSYTKYDKLTQELNILMIANGSFNKIMKSNDPIKYRMLSLMNERKQLINNYPSKFEVVNILVDRNKDDKIIIFNQFNEQTNKLYWSLLDIGVKARIIHSGIDKVKRDETLIDFKKDKFNVLLTSKVLDEGYNLPKIDTAIIMAGDSAGSRQIIQRMGRVLRKKEKNSNLYQIFCRRTIEEESARRHTKLFKELCSKYTEYIFDGKRLVI